MRTSIVASMLACSMMCHSGAQAQSLPGTGPTIGLNAGYGWGNSQQRDQFIPPPVPPVVEIPVPQDGDYHVRGASVGLSAGYGWLFDKLLLGIEGDINWAVIDGSSNVCGGDHTCGTELQGYGTLRGRVGTYLTPATLLYATGGLAVGRIHAFDRLVPTIRSD